MASADPVTVHVTLVSSGPFVEGGADFLGVSSLCHSQLQPPFVLAPQSAFLHPLIVHSRRCHSLGLHALISELGGGGWCAPIRAGLVPERRWVPEPRG